jgi:hypothetical protein
MRIFMVTKVATNQTALLFCYSAFMIAILLHLFVCKELMAVIECFGDSTGFAACAIELKRCCLLDWGY